MTLEQLRIFCEVAAREHMTGAAEALNLTQPAVSAAIAALEQRHGVKLFHRVGRRIELTGAGQAFLGEARGVLARAAAAEASLADLAGLTRGTLRLVASQTIAAYWLPPLLARYRARHPGIAIALAIGNTAQAARRIHDGEADLGVVEGLVDDPALAHWPLGEDRLVLVQGAAHDDSRHDDSRHDDSRHDGAAIDADWLRGARWVRREPGSGTRAAMDAVLRELGVAPGELDVSLELPSNESILSAVIAGAGVAALSELVVGPALAAGRVRRLPLDCGRRAFHGLRHKERYASRAAQALVDLIGEPRAPAS